MSGVFRHPFQLPRPVQNRALATLTLPGNVVTGTGTIAGVVDGADFDGVGERLTAASHTGQADNSQCIFSAWVRPDGGISTDIIFSSNDSVIGTTIDVRAVSGKVDWFFADATHTFSGSGLTDIQTDGLWHHILLSIDTNFTAGNKLVHLYIDGLEDSDSGSITDADGAFNIVNTGDNGWAIGADAATGGSRFDGCIAQVYYAIGAFKDFSVEADRVKFVDFFGHGRDYGPAGVNPTGTQPIIFQNNPFGSFETNLGTGSDWTVVSGPLGACSTSPELAHPSAVIGIGILRKTGDGVSTGTSTVSGDLTAVGNMAGSSAGIATVTGVLTATHQEDGTAAGTSTATAVGRDAAASETGDGSSTGTSTVTGVLKATHQEDGTSAGTSTVSGIANSTGSSSGVSTVTGVLSAVHQEDGTSAGTSTAIAIGRDTAAISGGGGWLRRRRRFG